MLRSAPHGGVICCATMTSVLSVAASAATASAGWRGRAGKIVVAVERQVPAEYGATSSGFGGATARSLLWPADVLTLTGYVQVFAATHGAATCGGGVAEEGLFAVGSTAAVSIASTHVGGGACIVEERGFAFTSSSARVQPLPCGWLWMVRPLAPDGVVLGATCGGAAGGEGGSEGVERGPGAA